MSCISKDLSLYNIQYFYLFFKKKITPNYTAKMINIEASKVMVEVKTLSNIARDVIDIVVGQC